MKTTLMNFIKVFILLLAGAALILLCSILPETQLVGTRVDVFLCAVLIDFVLFLTVGVTGHLYGGCVLAFCFPVIRYYLMGMVSPVMIIPEIMAGCFMLLTYCMVVQKNTPLLRAIGYAGGALVKYGVLWIVVGKLLPKFIDAIMMFQNVTDEEGFAKAIEGMQAGSLHGQLLSAIIAGILAFFLVPQILKVLPEKLQRGR